MSDIKRVTRGNLLFAAIICAVVFQTGCGDENTAVRPQPLQDPGVISLSRRSWYPASPPVDPGDPHEVLADGLHDKIFWYNIEPSYGARERDLNPGLPVDAKDLVPTLDMETAAAPGPDAGWTGVMRGIHPWLDLSDRGYIEIWVNDFKPDPADRGGVLYVDVGRIDENFYEPWEDHWNDEDRDSDGFNACIDDSGLDEMHNYLHDCVKNFYPDDPTEGGVDETDDRAGDDYLSRRIDGRFSKVNGTERNGNYDTEDLDRSGTLDRSNSYFRYAIDLADTVALDVRAEYPDYEGFDDPVHERDSWRRYRIELAAGEPVAPAGGPVPDLTAVRHIRVWFRDTADVVTVEDGPGKYRLQIAGLKFAGHP